MVWNSEGPNEEKADYIQPTPEKDYFLTTQKISSSEHELITPPIKVNSIMFIKMRWQDVLLIGEFLLQLEVMAK
jgi:hypothetical protein